MSRTAEVDAAVTPNDAQRKDIRRAFLCLAAAHEMRQPLNSISLNTDLMDKRLRKQAQTGEVEGPLAVVLRAVERMSTIVDAWLDRVAPEPIPAAHGDIWPVVAEAVRRAAGAAEKRRVKIALGPQGKLPHLQLHPLQLAVALDAILENAILAAPSPSEVSVAVTVTEDDVRVSVTDRGAGMTPEVVRQAVEVGFSTRGAEGVGLTIAKFVAYHHGGGFQIHSRPGEGTTVTISLPVGD